MTKEPDKTQGRPEEQEEKAKGYKNYLEFLKQSKNSSISMWMGKSSDLYKEMDGYVKDQASAKEQRGAVADPSFVSQGALKKAIEIARVDFVKVKLESEDPIELSEKFSSRLARLNDEYHHKKILYPKMEIIGFMKDKDTRQDRLLVVEKGAATEKVLAVDPETGKTVDTFVLKTQYSTVTLRRPE